MLLNIVSSWHCQNGVIILSHILANWCYHIISNWLYHKSNETSVTMLSTELIHHISSIRSDCCCTTSQIKPVSPCYQVTIHHINSIRSSNQQQAWTFHWLKCWMSLLIMFAPMQVAPTPTNTYEAHPPTHTQTDWYTGMWMTYMCVLANPPEEENKMCHKAQEMAGQCLTLLLHPVVHHLYQGCNKTRQL